MKRIKYILFLVIVMATLMIPFVAMPFTTPVTAGTEFVELAKPPNFWHGETWNYNFMYDVGTYFEDHFAFRPQALTVNAMLRGVLLNASGTRQVIYGRNGWLYFADTLDDFLGENLLNERELYAVVHNLRLMQEYVNFHGSNFTVAIIPNKNSLYPENMPANFWAGAENNWSNLRSLMIEYEISFVDFFELLGAVEERTYFKRDSHWTNYGAMLGNKGLMEFMGRGFIDYENVPYEIRRNHIGDLDEMLFPLAYIKENNIYFLGIMTYQHVTEVTDYMDNWIQTFNPYGSGSILMYRDSFGEYLLPFTANEFEYAYFSRYVPYNLSEVEHLRPEQVVIQRVERNIFMFANQTPIMEPVQVESFPENTWHPHRVDTTSTIHLQEHGAWLEIRGLIDKSYLASDSDIFVSMQGEQTGHLTFPVFYRMTANGLGNAYNVFLRGDLLAAEEIIINVLVRNQDGIFQVAQYIMQK